MFKKFLNRFFMLCAIGLVIASSSQVLAMDGEKGLNKEASAKKMDIGRALSILSKSSRLISESACNLEISEIDEIFNFIINSDLKENIAGQMLVLACSNMISGKIVKHLIKVGSKKVINYKDYAGRTPLHAAAYCSNNVIVKLLFEAGASESLNTRDREGRTPFTYAYEFNTLTEDNIEKIKLFLLYGADLEMIGYHRDGIIEELCRIVERFDNCCKKIAIFSFSDEEIEKISFYSVYKGLKYDKLREFERDLLRSKRKEIMEKEIIGFRSNMRKQEVGEKLCDCTAFTLE